MAVGGGVSHRPGSDLKTDVRTVSREELSEKLRAALGYTLRLAPSKVRAIFSNFPVFFFWLDQTSETDHSSGHLAQRSGTAKVLWPHKPAAAPCQPLFSHLPLPFEKAQDWLFGPRRASSPQGSSARLLSLWDQGSALRCWLSSRTFLSPKALCIFPLLVPSSKECWFRQPP